MSWQNRSVDGRISHPFGEDAIGFILYIADGYMSVAIMRRGRERFAAGIQQSAHLVLERV